MDINNLIAVCRREVKQGGFTDHLREFDEMVDQNASEEDEVRLIKAMQFVFYSNYMLGTWSAP